MDMYSVIFRTKYEIHV